MNVSRLTLLLLLACFVTANAQRSTPPDKLPPNFSGDDPAILLRQLIDLRKRLLKDEFETTPAYEARVIEEKKKPLIGHRTIETTYLLVAHTVHAEYNADTQIMTFTLPVQTNYDGDVSSRDNVDKKTMTPLTRLAKYQVSLGGDTDPHVFFDRAPGLYGPGPHQNFTVTAKLDAADARRLKTHTKAVLSVRFEEPYATTDYQEGGQFLVQLFDVFFFDERTSIVLGKVSSPQIAAPAKPAVTQNPDYSTYSKNPTFKWPRILAKPEATYTEEASRHHITGTVLLEVMFAETGQINNIRVLRGLSYGLTERAIAAARQIRFAPAELDGKKVDFPMRIVYTFELH
jgi:TonB family protein